MSPESRWAQFLNQKAEDYEATPIPEENLKEFKF